VHGHHAHQPQGVERYGDGIISYGSGNMMVSPERWADGINTFWSLAVDVDLKSRPLEYRVFPTEIRRQRGKLIAEPSTEAEAKAHHAYIEAATLPLSDPLLLESLWQETSLRAMIGLYADPLRAPTGTRRRFNLKQRIKATRVAIQEVASAFCGFEVSTNMNRRNRLNWHHYFRCLSHSDAIATALGVLSGVIPDLRTDVSSRLADQFMPAFPHVKGNGSIPS
jgi:hypothetical protein